LDMVPLRALSHEQQTNGMHARAMNIAELWPTVLSQLLSHYFVIRTNQF
jgi:hypothetical protein